MKKTALFLALLALPALADETPETLLIRQALDSDKFGHRRGEVDLALAAFAPRVVVYAGNRSADPRAWRVLHENREALERAVEQELRANRYDHERLVPYIHVRGRQALVTTLDSGQVVDRQTGESRPVRTERLWTFAKFEDKWLATGVVLDIGSELLPPAQGSAPAEIVRVLKEEEEAWEKGSAGAIAGLFDENFIGGDGAGQLSPDKWVLLFSGAEELEKWLEKRLQRTRYAIDRQVVHAYLSPAGGEALALTREQVFATYEDGPATHRLERSVLWSLSRQSGSWKITGVFYRLGLPE